MYGSLVLTVEPEKKCAHVIESFEPTESLLREYCTLIKQYIKGSSIPVECTLKEQ